MTKTPPLCRDQRYDHPYRGVAFLVFQLSRHVATALDRQLAPFNVTSQQAGLLIRSCKAWDASPARLASALGTDAAGVTRLLDRLEAKELIARRTSPTDRRAIVVEPTEAGRALVPQLLPAFRGVAEQLLDGLTVEEVELLETLLRRLLQNVTTCEQGEGHEGKDHD